jgi:hypothetical protein
MEIDDAIDWEDKENDESISFLLSSESPGKLMFISSKSSNRHR